MNSNSKPNTDLNGYFFHAEATQTGYKYLFYPDKIFVFLAAVFFLVSSPLSESSFEGVLPHLYRFEHKIQPLNDEQKLDT